MSVGETKSLIPVQNSEITGVGSSKSSENKSSIQKEIAALFSKGRDFIFSKLNGKAGALITLGQVGGAAAMAAGGLALIFSGIGANLTVGGIPLGIPLLAGGAALFAAGTGLLIVKLAMNSTSKLGEKIKDFFSITLKNTAIGVGLGVFVAGIASKVSIEELPATLEKAKKVKEKVGETLPEVLSNVDKFNGIVNPKLGKENTPTSEKQDISRNDELVLTKSGPIIEELDDSGNVIGRSETIPTDKTQALRLINPQNSSQISEQFSQEYEKKAFDAMRFLLAYYVLNNQPIKL